MSDRTVGGRGARILLGYELGAGIGYAARLRRLALDLAAEGHRPVVALRDLDLANPLFGTDELTVVQAPYLIGRLPARPPGGRLEATGFADVMAINGFGSEDHLFSMVSGWRGLIDLVRPALIVGTFCPLLTTAAYGRIPTVVFGAGYSTPPADADEFPRLRRDGMPLDDQGDLLATVRRVQDRCGAPVPHRLTDIYRGDRRLVTTFPEIDPYRHARSEPCVGHFDALGGPSPIAERRVYGYVAGTGPIARRIVDGLAMSGFDGSFYARQAPSALRPPRSGSSVVRLERAPDLESAVRAAAVVVHHGGINTTQVALALGRPQVIVPRVLDQQLTAEALGGLPFVAALDRSAPAETIAGAIEELIDDPGAAAAAVEAAVSIHQRRLHDARARVVEAALDLLA